MKKDFVDKTKLDRYVDIKKPVVNYMGGVSYELNPLDTLKLVTASSIFGEPQYYRDGEFAVKGVRDGIYKISDLFKKYSVIDNKYENMKTSEMMEKIIDEALSYDFEATIRWAVKLRKEFNMRLNPQVIMVRAAIHPDRAKFNEEHGDLFTKINKAVMSRADEPATQLTYYLYKNKKKNNIPNCLKRSWKDTLENTKRYALNKYKNSAVGIIDTVRICHANSDDINELMTTGTLTVSEDKLTWENYISANGSSKETWDYVVDNIFTHAVNDNVRNNMNTFEYDDNIYVATNHMAILRNLRNIGKYCDEEHIKKVLLALKCGVLSGKQFPFRYYSAYHIIEHEDGVKCRVQILDALEECADISCENLPKLKGKTMCLSDNSGSAWGAITSEYGTVHIANIDNLSSVIAAHNSDEGYVGKFGNDLRIIPVNKRSGILQKTNEICVGRYHDVGGGGTENGIWVFFRDAIDKKEWYDNIIIFSDQQAGHGGLYGTSQGRAEYIKRGFAVYNSYVDVAKLIQEYRNKVNPKVNVMSVQTAGYTNVVIPENGYRTTISYGWTGSELAYFDKMIKFWDEKETK